MTLPLSSCFNFVAFFSSPQSQQQNLLLLLCWSFPSQPDASILGPMTLQRSHNFNYLPPSNAKEPSESSKAKQNPKAEHQWPTWTCSVMKPLSTLASAPGTKQAIMGHRGVTGGSQSSYLRTAPSSSIDPKLVGYPGHPSLDHWISLDHLDLLDNEPTTS